MRLLWLTDDYLPHFGGSRVYYHELISHLGSDIDVTVLTKHRNGDAAFDTRQSYSIKRCHLEPAHWLRPLRLQFITLYCSLFFQGFKLMRRQKPECIVAGELLPTGLVGLLLAWFYKCPLIVFTHAEGPATLARTRLQSRLARWVVRHADAVVAASDNAAEGLVDFMGAQPEKITTILPGVSDAHFDEKLQAHPFEQGREQIKILSVGRLIQRKGHIYLLDAFERIRKKIVRKLHLTIVGQGPEEGKIREYIVAQGLESHVELITDIEQDALMSLYADSDLFVLCNHDIPERGDTEGFVIVFGEAGAHGLPVVGGRDGGTVHSIADGETGLRIDARESQMVADAITKLLTDTQEAQAMGQRARKRAFEHLRWSERARVFESLLLRNK